MTTETNQRLVKVDIVPRRKIDELIGRAYWSVNSRPSNGHPSFRGARSFLKKASTELKETRSTLAGRILTYGCERKIGNAKRDLYSRAIPYHKGEIERLSRRHGANNIGNYEENQIRLYERWLRRFGRKDK